MSFINKEVCQKLKEAFPQSFINMNFEFICNPKRNSYFLLEDVTDELVLKCKILEWLSREACKSGDNKSKDYHLAGINKYFNQTFTSSDMDLIYTSFGNSVNRNLTIQFIENNCNLELLKQ